MNKQNQSTHNKLYHKLIDVLKEAGLDLTHCEIISAYSIQIYYGEKTFKKIENFREYQILEGIAFFDAEENRWIPKEVDDNILIHISYKEKTHIYYADIHICTWGHLDKEVNLLSRLFILDKKEETEIIDYTFSYNEENGENLINDIDNSEESQDSITSDIENGKKLAKEEKWRDAAHYYTRIYEGLNSDMIAERLNEDGEELYYKTCYDLGLSYYNMGLYAKSALYMDLASLNEETIDYRSEYDLDSEFNSRINSPLGELIESLTDILPEELLELIWVDNDTLKTHSTKKQSDILALDLKKLMSKHKSVSLYISHKASKNDCAINSAAKDVLTPFIDNILNLENEIIITLTKEDEIATMTIISNRYRYAYTLNFVTDEILPLSDFHQLKKESKRKASNKEEINEIEYYSLEASSDHHRLFIQGLIGFENNLSADTIVNLSKAFRIILLKWQEEKPEDYDIRIFGKICYMLGFTYMGLYKYDYAIYYLDIISDLPNIKWKIEYINSLTNSKDIRAFEFVYDEIKNLTDDKAYEDVSEEDIKTYFSFLKRRLGFLMIEQQRFDEAKEYFSSILNDPYCMDFALEELEYLSLH